MPQEISELLKKRREQLGLSKRVVARLADVSPPTIALAESGSLGTVGTLERHLEALGCELRAVPAKSLSDMRADLEKLGYERRNVLELRGCR
jgi:transcriptional regulator with XRE-family HTH domain